MLTKYLRRVSEGIRAFFAQCKELGFVFKARVSEIRVKRIRVNQGVGVFLKIVLHWFKYT